MNMLSSTFAHVLYCSLIASVIIVLLLLIKKCSRNRFSGRVSHLMWILVLIRLLIPFEIESPYSINAIFPESTPIIFNSQEYMGNQSDDNSMSGIQHENDSQELAAGIYDNNDNRKSFSWYLGIFGRIWLIGVLAITSFIGFITISFKRKNRDFARVHDPEIIKLVQQFCNRLGIKHSIPIYTDSYFSSPCIAGILSPGIYLPQDICNHIHYHQLEHILLHELVHYKRRDLVYSWLAVIAAMFHWFNPLVWLAVREMRYDREIASDAYVMELLGEPGVIPYGNTLIKLASVLPNHPAPLNMASFNETHKQIERRITMIKMFKKGSYKISALAMVSFILVGALAFTIAGCVKQDDNALLNVNAPANHENSAINNEIKNMLVVIDPGHGGEDFGGIYPFDTTNPELMEMKEKELNLEISLLLSDMLKKSGIQVKLTRSDDSTIELDKRLQLANQSHAALIVSVHNDMHPDESINGTRTFYYSGDGASLSRFPGGKAAQIIQTHLTEQLGTTDLGMSNSNFKLLEQAGMCAVITEISYITNESDRQNLMTEEFRIKASQALHDGIIEVLTEMATTKSKK